MAFIEILIWALEKYVGVVHSARTSLTKEQEDGLLSQLWQNEAFRKHIADRDLKIIYTMAGGEGMGPEPRETYSLHAGQRIENLVLGRDAKAAFLRLTKRKEQELLVEAGK